MATKGKKRPLTDTERHKRFVEMAREVEASGKAKDYDRVLKKLAAKKPKERQTANRWFRAMISRLCP